MLLAIRDRITGIVAWSIVVLISIPFMLWGVQEYFGMGQDQIAVSVNDREISLREFDRAMAQNRQRLARQFGGSIPEYFDAETFLREQTLSQLTNRELLRETLDEDRYRVPSQTVADQIIQDPRFQTDGEFNPDIYAAELRQLGMSKQEYEREKINELASQQLQRGVQSTAFVPSAELADYARLRYQTRGFEFIQLALADFREEVDPVSDEAIAEYYEEHKDEYKTQENVKVAYIELSLQALADGVPVDEELLRQQYQEAIDNGRYQSEEVREARHILIKVPPDAPEEEVNQARERIQQLRQQLQQGADFAELAGEHSEDAGSARQGGSLGEVRRGAMVKPFEDALFALEPGVVSEPVKTRFGFHLIKVDEILPSKTKPFSEVREELASEYRRRQAESMFFDRLDVLATQAFENSGTLDPAAEAIDAEIQQSGFFTRQQPAEQNPEGISSHQSVREAAFSDSVLLDGRNSELIEVDKDHVVVLRVAEHRPSRPKELDEARGQIAKTIRNQRAQEALDQAAAGLMQQIGEDDSLVAVAEQHPKASYERTDPVRRKASKPNPQIVKEAFRMPPPSVDPAVQRLDLRNGDVALIRLNDVNDGNLQALEAQEKRELTQQLVQGRGQYDFQAFLAHLKAQAEIVTNPDLQQQGDQAQAGQ